MFNEENYKKLNEDEQHKELYAYFGLLVYYFQVIEHELLNMILCFNKSKDLTISLEQYDKMFYENSSNTMGQLIKKIIDKYCITDKDKNLLKELLNKRNFVVHHFFKDRILKTHSLTGRIELIKELNILIDKTKSLDRKLEAYHQTYLDKFGLNETDIDFLYTEYLKGNINIPDDGLKFEKQNNTTS